MTSPTALRSIQAVFRDSPCGNRRRVAGKVVPHRGAHQLAAHRCKGALEPASGSLLSSQPLHNFRTKKLWREVELQMTLGDGAGSGVRVSAAEARLAEPGPACTPRPGIPRAPLAFCEPQRAFCSETLLTTLQVKTPFIKIRIRTPYCWARSGQVGRQGVNELASLLSLKYFNGFS